MKQLGMGMSARNCDDIKSAREARYVASEYHDSGTSIPVTVFETLCKYDETPSKLWKEFNEDARVEIPLFPLLTIN